MSADNVLALEKVHHTYDDGGGEVLHDINLAITRGEIFCLLGPSGCGKTTTLRLAAGLEDLQRGRILINGQVVADGRMNLPPERRGTGLVFQDQALFPHLTVFENVAFGVSSLPEAKRRARVMEVLAQVDMTAYVDAYPHVLSGGQQQRVALARALAPDPRLMLLDEPFSGLDAQLRSQVRELTLTILKQNGSTALIVTHDPEEAMYVADRIAVMNAGRIEQMGKPDELYCHPASAFVTRFFSSINNLVGTVRNGAVNTPFGRLPALDFEDGSQVEILIRPEALRISPAGGVKTEGGAGVAEGQVQTVRMLRRAVFMHLCMGDFEGKHLHFHVRSPGHRMPEEGARVLVTLDPEQTFIFPVRDTA